MAISLTNKNLTPVAGQAAFLPNQPILHNCVVSSTAAAALVPGSVVALATDANYNDSIVVKQAAVTDEPLGVIVNNPIKTGFAATDRVSVFPVNSYVYMTAGAVIARGSKLQFTAANKVAATATANNGYIGIAMTAAAADGDLVVVQIQPGKQAAA